VKAKWWRWMWSTWRD